jgi:hypothetical protein
VRNYPIVIGAISPAAPEQEQSYQDGSYDADIGVSDFVLQFGNFHDELLSSESLLN